METILHVHCSGRICFAFAIIVHTLFQGTCFQVFWDLAARSTRWSWSVHTFPWEMPSGVLPSTNQAHIFTLHLHCVNPSSVSLHYLLFKDFGNIYLQVIMWIFKLITEWTDYSASTCLKVSFLTVNSTAIIAY